jgi:hypothetical protein
MKVAQLVFTRFSLVAWLAGCALLSVSNATAQTLSPDLKPDMRRVLSTQRESTRDRGGKQRPNGYVSAGSARSSAVRYSTGTRTNGSSLVSVARPLNYRQGSDAPSTVATTPILPGTPLFQVLHTSQLSLISAAGTNEQFVDRTGNLVADERTTFDSSGGSFDIAVGRSGARYEVFSATLNSELVGVIVVALDTNGDYLVNTSSTFNLRTDFSLRSAAAVVTGTSKAGREFVIVCSSGYYNSSNPNDPNNEPSPGIVLLVRDPNTGFFDTALSRALVTVGDNRLYNANALALLPNNDLLVADFHSNELRIIRDTDADGVPDTLSTTPYYIYQFANDEPLDIAANARGVVFSHSAGNDTVLLALYDDNADGRADRDEVCVEGLSIDDNLFLHGLTVDSGGNVYVIEDASGLDDGAAGNGGTPRADAFPDPRLDGFLIDGSIFAGVDDPVNQGLTGLAFGALTANPIDDAQFFVRRHYLDFLNREPDGSGLAFWTDQITSCGANVQCLSVKRTNVSAAFFLSIEFQETGYLVYRIYKSAYGNRPNAPVPVAFNEFLPDTQLIGQNVVVGSPNWQAQLESNKQAFAAAFVARSRFITAFSTTLTPTQFVDALYVNAGVTSPPPTERSAAINEFGGAGNTSDAAARGRALRRVAENSTLGQQELNRAFVLMQYFGYLRRNPNDAPEAGLNFDGYNFWLNKLNQFNGNFVDAEMVKAFITAGEYRSRFGL